jgi:hypothetical protein
MIYQINLNIIGWMDGITATLVVIFAGLFGILMYLKSRESGASLLAVGGGMGFFVGLLWLGPTSDFFSVLLLQRNLPSVEIYGILSYMWVAPAMIFAMYLGGQLMFPKQKKLIMWISIILGVVFELFLFLDTDGAFEDIPDPMGVELIDAHFIYGHPAFIIIAIILGSIFMLNGLGSLRAGLKSSGAIRKKFIYLSLSFFLFIPVAIFDAFLDPGFVLFAIRMLMICVAWLMYLSLRIKIL